MDNIKKNLIKKISDDINVYSYNEENNKEYIARLLYSAISIHIRLCILDKRVFDKKVFKSKKYILSKGEEVLEAFLLVFPEVRGWFYNESNKESPIVTIRDRLERTGYIISVGFNTDLGIPKSSFVTISSNSKLIRGISNVKLFNIAGLLFIDRNRDKCNNIDFKEINRFFNYDTEGLENVYFTYLNKPMNEIKESDQLKVFDKYGNKRLSNCWGDVTNLKDDDITIYKYNDFDYGFIKKKDSRLFLSSISKYDIERLEVRRYMLNLKSECGNPSIAYVNKVGKGYVQLKLTNKLPTIEESILLGLGWPKNNINDVTNLVFRREVWDYIKLILTNLKIRMVEDKYGEV